MSTPFAEYTVSEGLLLLIFLVLLLWFFLDIVKSKMTQQNEAQNYPRLKMGAANGHRPKRGCV